MKCLTFMEAIREYLANVPVIRGARRGGRLQAIENHLTGVGRLLALYEMPFTPAMLDPGSGECLFAETKRHMWAGPQFASKDGSMLIDFNRNQDSYWIYNMVEGNRLVIVKPKTVSDFINDCTRTGITIEWTERAIQAMEGTT